MLAYQAVTTALLFVQWNLPSWNPLLWLWACFMGVTVAVMAHNHMHQKIWRNDVLNALTDYWITVFYGFPVFAWIPTHNRNHHRYTDKPGDHTATWKLSPKNNLWTLLTYPTMRGIWQQTPIREYLKQQWRNNRKRFWYSVSQYVVLAVWIGVALAIDWRKALLYVVIPQQVGLNMVLVFNYVQHVHADRDSEYDHSRNIVGWTLNALLFNNGYHTIHHLKPNLHWSELPAEHAKIAHLIDPKLNEPSFWGMILKFYVLGAFSDRYRSQPMRPAPEVETA
jgi:fatty acid desaturase